MDLHSAELGLTHFCGRQEKGIHIRRPEAHELDSLSGFEYVTAGDAYLLVPGLALPVFAAVNLLAFEFALDDFGKGASNLMYAIEMPVKVIKLDMELTQLFMKDDKAKAVVHAIIKMAHDMKLKVVSEGVETKEEVEIITKAGIDYIQGFYFSKPLPKSEYLEFLKEHQK